jgi:hypothetical protein
LNEITCGNTASCHTSSEATGAGWLGQ